MKKLSGIARTYIISTIIIGVGLIVWTGLKMEGTNPGLYILVALGAVAQTLKVEGPNERTNYSIAWFVYGFTFIALGPPAALLVVFVAHLVEWAWHKYPWYIQSFNIGAHVLSVFLAGLVFTAIGGGAPAMDLNGAIAIVASGLVFVFANHFLVGVVVKLARGQSFAESGIFGFLTLFLDFTILSMGAVTALVWFTNPFAAVLNVLPLYLLYQAIRVPQLERRLEAVEQQINM